MYTMSYRCCARIIVIIHPPFKNIFFVVLFFLFSYYGREFFICWRTFCCCHHVVVPSAHTCTTTVTCSQQTHVWDCMMLRYIILYIYIQLYIKTIHLHIYWKIYLFMMFRLTKEKKLRVQFRNNGNNSRKKAFDAFPCSIVRVARPPQNGFSAQHAKTFNRTVGRR
jgi:hypothetical protein